MNELDLEPGCKFPLIENSVEKKEAQEGDVKTVWTVDRISEAVDNFDQESKLNYNLPLDIQLLLNKAKHQMKNNDNAGALESYRAAMMKDSMLPEAIRGAAESSSNLGDHENAILFFERLMYIQDSDQNRILLADELYATGQFERAEKFYRSALDATYLSKKVIFNVLKNLGNIALQSDRNDQAREYYMRAHSLDPRSDILLVNIGSLHLRGGELNEALSKFREAVQINDKNAKAWIGLAVIHREFGDHELAWANVERALDIDPKNETSIKLICEWALKDNKPESAVPRLEVFNSKNTGNSEMLMWEAKFLYLSDRVFDALAVARKAQDLNSSSPEIASVYAVISDEAKRIERRRIG